MKGKAIEPLVSVIIPAYNHERYVGDAIASVTGQSYSRLEIIIVNDGSTDRTGSICARAARLDERIRYVEQPNRGAHRAINRGLRLAHGDCLTILNSDDLYMHDRIERCLSQMKRYRADFVAGHAQLIGADGNPLQDGPAVDWQRRGYAFLNECGHLPLAILNENIIATTSNMFFNRAILGLAGPFQPLRYCHDLDFLMAVFRHGRYVFDSQHPHIRYRVHPANTIQETIDRVQREIAAVIAVCLVEDRLRLLRSVDGRSLHHFYRFFRNKGLTLKIAAGIMRYLAVGDRSRYYHRLATADRI